jgi:hypothetical protein
VQSKTKSKAFLSTRTQAERRAASAEPGAAGKEPDASSMPSRDELALPDAISPRASNAARRTPRFWFAQAPS